MMQSAFRLTRLKYAIPPHDPFDGKGSAREGGRWNLKGTRTAYASWCLSLAILETVVHSRGEWKTLSEYAVNEISFPQEFIEWYPLEKLPANWSDPYHPPPALAEMGQKWVERGKTSVLAVPSSIVASEWNFLINPEHHSFQQFERRAYRPFTLDPRLLQS